MLQSLKRGANTWVAKILLGLLVLSFAVWGVTGASFNFASGTLANVGSQRISTIDFQREFVREIQQVGRQIGRPLTSAQARQFGLDREVLSRLINQATLDDRVEAFGIGVSDEKVTEDLLKDPVFLNEQGVFDAFRFQQLLVNAQLSEEEFLERQTGAVERQQLVAALTGDFFVSNVWRDLLSEYASEERTIDYVTIDVRDIASIENPSDEDLTSYFDNNKSRYRAPEYRSLNLLSIEVDDFDNASTITEEQARDEYDRNLSQYIQPEQRNVKRITFSTDAQAEEAKQKLDSGTSFSELQAELGLSDSDVELGFLQKEQILDQKIAETAFELPINTPSNVIDGDFAKAIVFVDRIDDGKTQSFEDVEQSIRQELANDQNIRDMLAKVNEIEDARAAGNTFQEISERLNVPLVRFENISRNGELEATGQPVSDIPAQNAVLDEAFNSDIGLENDSIENGRTGFVWYEVTDIKPSRERTLEEVRDTVLSDWKEQQTAAAVTAKAQEVLQAVTSENTLAKVAEKEGLLLKRVEQVRRDTPASGLSGAAVGLAFQGARYHTAVAPGESSNQAVVLQVMEINKGTVPEEIPGITDVQDGMENDILTVYISQVREREGSTFNAETFQFATDLEGGHQRQGFGG